MTTNIHANWLKRFGSFLIIKRFLLALSLSLIMFAPTIYAVEPLANNMINFASQSGAVLLKESVNQNTLKLLANFTTQNTGTYCGIASAVIILNSTKIIAPIDPQHTPYTYFTQEDFFNDNVKQIITPEEVQATGISLTNLSLVLQSYGLQATPHFANEFTLNTFREQLKTALATQQFIIVNFARAQLQQTGGGHHSPLAAYNETTDRFLLLDVARYKYPAYWVTTQDLWNSINTLDDGNYRGFILIK